MGNCVRNSVFEMTLVAPEGGYAAGTIINHNGYSWVKMGLQDAAEGDHCTFRRDLQVEITKASSATAFSAGDRVGYNSDAQTVVALGEGDFDLYGTVRKAAGSGVATVLFALNEYNAEDEESA